MCSFFFLFGICLCFPGGILIRELLEHWSAAWNVVIICLLEVIIVSWIYGIDKFYDNLLEMGLQPTKGAKIYFKICLRFLTPITLITVLSVKFLECFTKTEEGRTYWEALEEPLAQLMSWLLGIFTLSFIPVVAKWQLLLTCIRRKTIDRTIFQPTQNWKPQSDDDSKIMLKTFNP